MILVSSYWYTRIHGLFNLNVQYVSTSLLNGLIYFGVDVERNIITADWASSSFLTLALLQRTLKLRGAGQEQEVGYRLLSPELVLAAGRWLTRWPTSHLESWAQGHHAAVCRIASLELFVNNAASVVVYFFGSKSLENFNNY